MEKLVFAVDTEEIRGTYLLKVLSACGCNTVLWEDEPSFLDCKTVYLPSFSAEIDLEKAMSFKENSTVFVRSITKEAKEFLKEKNIECFCYLEDEAFVVKNAVLTAEGALSYLIQNTVGSLRKMSVLVLGFGRVGKAVTKLLCDNKAEVSVATDDKNERAAAQLFSEEIYSLSDSFNHLHQFSAVVNTVPKVLLKGENLKTVKNDCFILDLASVPGGLDYDAAKKLSVKFLHALGVPGKTSPKAAALNMRDCIFKKLELNN